MTQVFAPSPIVPGRSVSRPRLWAEVDSAPVGIFSLCPPIHAFERHRYQPTDLVLPRVEIERRRQKKVPARNLLYRSEEAKINLDLTPGQRKYASWKARRQEAIS